MRKFLIVVSFIVLLFVFSYFFLKPVESPKPFIAPVEENIYKITPCIGECKG